jgi:hypothetical protein
LALAMAAQALVGAVALWGVSPAVTAAGWALLAVYALFGALFGQMAAGSFVPGAADNASGAAAVLSLASAWCRDPIDGVELVPLLTGCEETVLLGAAAWADRHRDELRAVPTLFLNLDGLGFGPPRFLGWDVPALGLPVAYPPALLDTARAVAAEQGLTNAGPCGLPALTDGLAFLKRGILGLTIIGCRDNGRLPNYHRMSDTADAIDWNGAFAGLDFAWALLRRLAQPAADPDATAGTDAARPPAPHG